MNSRESSSVQSYFFFCQSNSQNSDEGRFEKEREMYLVFVIFMQVYATLLPSLPLYGNTRVDVRLMYNLRDQLCSIIDKV